MASLRGSVRTWRDSIPRLIAVLLVLGSVIGCSSFKKKHENPVLGDAPRRISADDSGEIQVADASAANESTEADNEFVKPAKGFQLDPWEDWKDDTAIYNSKVAAMVNGAPILNGDVLDRYSGFLISVRDDMRKKRVGPDQYEKLREAYVQRDLPAHIQRRLLVESMRSGLKPEQMKALEGHLDMLFEKEIEKLKRELKVSTRTELELELNKKGTTLQNVRDSFATERMAMEYVAMKMDKAEHIDRQNLLDYYQEHLDDYRVPATVTWEQVQVSFQSSPPKARQKADQAMKELQSGVPFADVARKYSDGPTAKQGGRWDPMEAGSLVDTKLEELLFELPVGELSEIHEGTSAFQVVRVVERTEDGRIAFGEVQDEIRQKLEQNQNRERSTRFLQSLMADAVIETKYDLQQPQQP